MKNRILLLATLAGIVGSGQLISMERAEQNIFLVKYTPGIVHPFVKTIFNQN